MPTEPHPTEKLILHGGVIVVNARATLRGIPTIYIGRAVRNRKASPLGNPFRIKDEYERPAAIEQYRAWLTEQMESDTPARREIHRIAEFAAGLAEDTPLGLVCWCKEADREVLCHGDVVKGVLDPIIAEMREKRR
jgi:hypothetical protein